MLTLHRVEVMVDVVGVKLLGLGNVLHRLIDGILINPDGYVVVYFQHDVIVLNFADAAIDASSGHYFITFLQAFTEGVDLLLLLLLGIHNKEIENSNQGYNHDHAAPA